MIPFPQAYSSVQEEFMLSQMHGIRPESRRKMLYKAFDTSKESHTAMKRSLQKETVRQRVQSGQYGLHHHAGEHDEKESITQSTKRIRDHEGS